MRQRRLFIGPLDLKKDLRAWSGTPPNPGIGGTEFQLISLARELALMDSDLDITLLLLGGSSDLGSISGVNVANFRSSMTFDHTMIVVCPASMSRNLEAAQFKGGQLVISSHHPHDFEARKATRRLPVACVRSVGAYSFFALGDLKSSSVYIPNLFLSEMRSSPMQKSSIPTVGNISSWHPSKGVHHVFGVFAKLSMTSQPAKFELVGGLGLYDPSAPPSRTNRAQRLMLRAERQIANSDKTLIQHGVSSTGVVKLVEDWNAAVLNPLGIGESDPASFKDCLAQGIPVFSLGDFGMWDYQRFFPEFQAKKVSELPALVGAFASDWQNVDKASAKSLRLAKSLQLRNIKVLEKWLCLLGVLGESKDASPYFEAALAPAFIDRKQSRRLQFRRYVYKFEALYRITLFTKDRLATGSLTRCLKSL
jgi:hypothetical protein